MGTTLTGTTPQDTYDSLIKVTDNGPLSGTAKYLSDGLGNDSALALSTSAVGIGTTSLFADLQVNKASDVTLALSNSTAVTSGNRGSLSFYNSAVSTVALIKATAVTDNVGTQLEFYTRPAAGSLAQTMTIASTGNVGIGTSSPETKLNLVGGNIRLNTGSGTVGTSSSIEFSASTNNSVVSAEIKSTRTSGAGADLKFFTTTSVGVSPTEKLSILDGGGITFNGDTAQANALDDYEEGTWTMSVAFGGASVGVTYTANTGTYTKIGRQVTVNGFMQLSNKGSSTGAAAITGLPFAVANTTGNYSAASLAYITNITFADTLQGYPELAQTRVTLTETTNAGVRSSLTDADFANNSELMISFTYFV